MIRRQFFLIALSASLFSGLCIGLLALSGLVSATALPQYLLLLTVILFPVHATKECISQACGERCLGKRP